MYRVEDMTEDQLAGLVVGSVILLVITTISALLARENYKHEKKYSRFVGDGLWEYIKHIYANDSRWHVYHILSAVWTGLYWVFFPFTMILPWYFRCLPQVIGVYAGVHLMMLGFALVGTYFSWLIPFIQFLKPEKKNEHTD